LVWRVPSLFGLGKMEAEDDGSRTHVERTPSFGWILLDAFWDNIPLDTGSWKGGFHSVDGPTILRVGPTGQDHI
jgi:hypothetical protein